MSEELIEKGLAALREKSKLYAQAKAECEYLDEFKKSKIAILMKTAEASGVGTAAGQEREARASGDYQMFLNGLRAATERAEALRWSLQIDMAAIEIWRTKRSDRRAEMNMR